MVKTKVEIVTTGRRTKEKTPSRSNIQIDASARSTTHTSTARSISNEKIRSVTAPKKPVSIVQSKRKGADKENLPEEKESKLETNKDKYNRRYRPSEKAMKDIRKFNKVKGLMIRRLPFQRLVRDISNQFSGDEPFRLFNLI